MGIVLLVAKAGTAGALGCDPAGGKHRRPNRMVGPGDETVGAMRCVRLCAAPFLEDAFSLLSAFWVMIYST